MESGRSPRGSVARTALMSVAVLLLVADAALILSNRGEPRPGTPDAGERPRRGGTLRVLLREDVDSLDPQSSGRPSSWFFMRLLHRGLMAFGPAERGARPVPDLAVAAPQVSADGKTYRFSLRPGARFGPPASRTVTSSDVKAGLERLLRLRAEVSPYFAVIAGAPEMLGRRAGQLRGVATPDAATVVVRLRRPANDLLSMLALPQASAVPVETARRTRVRAAGIAPSGPYRIAKYSPERRLRLVRNPGWDPRSDPLRGAYADEVDVAIGPTQRAIDARIAAGDADVQADSPTGRPPAATALSQPNGCLRYLWTNTTVAPFGDRRVRRAVALALDASGFAPPARGVAASGVLPPTVLGSAGYRAPPLGRAPDPATTASPAAAPTGNLRDARALLRAAGLRRGFSTMLVAGATTADRADAATARRMLARAGIRVTVRFVPASLVYPDWYERPARRVPMGVATWCAEWPGPGGRSVIGALLDGRRIRPEGNTVYSMVRSTALNAAIDAATEAASEPEAAALWRRADRIAVALAAAVPLVWTHEHARRSERLRGGAGHPFYVRGDPARMWLASR